MAVHSIGVLVRASSGLGPEPAVRPGRDIAASVNASSVGDVVFIAPPIQTPSGRIWPSSGGQGKSPSAAASAVSRMLHSRPAGR